MDLVLMVELKHIRSCIKTEDGVDLGFQMEL